MLEGLIKQCTSLIFVIAKLMLSGSYVSMPEKWGKSLKSPFKKNQKATGQNIMHDSLTCAMTSSETIQHCLLIYETLQYQDLFFYRKKRKRKWRLAFPGLHLLSNTEVDEFPSFKCQQKMSIRPFGWLSSVYLIAV